MLAPRFLPAGETALVVEYGRAIDGQAHAAVLALDAALASRPIDGVLESVPTYRSLMVHFDPRRLDAERLIDALRALDPAAVRMPDPKRWRLPVCYDRPHAEDLDEVARHLSLAPEHVIALHAGAAYTVVMYGFAPGFVFLDGLPADLALSRRATPRPSAPAGALTIAGGQALVASIAMPTGWYMLGRTPARTFDPRRDPVFPMAVGDHVAIERIDAARFDALAVDAEAGRPVLVEAS